MNIPRVIPCLLLRGSGLVKTIRFKDPTYLGDPRNTIKIFNEKGVDELVFLDITATIEKRGPNFELISEITSECFMPLGYGGGISNLGQMEKLFKMGVEKVAVNTYAVVNPPFVSEAARAFGSQSVVVSLDVKRSLLGKYEIMVEAGKRKSGLEPVTFAKQMEEAGAGELLLNSIDRDGTMQGYDLEMIKRVTSAVNIPVIACGGAGSPEDFGAVVRDGGASAVAAGSIFVFHGRHRAVLINFPKRNELERIFN
ncbi:MAG: AglZ/HisF2 family acetamidino modification protein [Syntrophales bacterium LBB04]|nr:AglZ/HisF2 family acetamidino modification protein [Syntrophales bacterium LBB04]